MPVGPIMRQVVPIRGYVQRSNSNRLVLIRAYRLLKPHRERHATGAHANENQAAGTVIAFQDLVSNTRDGARYVRSVEEQLAGQDSTPCRKIGKRQLLRVGSRRYRALIIPLPTSQG